MEAIVTVPAAAPEPPMFSHGGGDGNLRDIFAPRGCYGRQRVSLLNREALSIFPSQSNRPPPPTRQAKADAYSNSKGLECSILVPRECGERARRLFVKEDSVAVERKSEIYGKSQAYLISAGTRQEYRNTDYSVRGHAQ